MRVLFAKMHGLGNDFVVIDATTVPLVLTPEQIRFLAHRQLGIGCDQILLVESTQTPDVDFRYRIFNADGSEVEQCGNGARCFARFVHLKGLTDKKILNVETKAGLIQLRSHTNETVTVDMGIPRLLPAEIPFMADATALQYPIVIDNQTVSIGAVSMGNPHAVLQVADLNEAPVGALGARLSIHPRFPNGVNVGFMKIEHRTHIQLRVYERGVGETLACGTGACAAVVIGRRWGQLDTSVTVDLPGGSLQIEWSGQPHESVLMTGPATFVFEGSIDL